MKVFRVCRVLTPKVTCILLQRVQLLVLLNYRLRARGNRDIPPVVPQRLTLLWPSAAIACDGLPCMDCH
jgi:hypothetical protein